MTSKTQKHNTYGWLVTSLSGVFMFLVLFVYRAYHIDAVPAFTGHSMLFRAMAHSLIISTVFYLIEFHVAPRLRIRQKIKPFITALIAIFLGLHLTFLTFNYFFHWTEFLWLSYAQFLYEYPLILAVPVILSYLIAETLHPIKHATTTLLTFTSENQKEHFQLKPENLLYIKSAQNYVEIFYLSTQQVGKRLLRRSLKHIEEEPLFQNTLIRCHRSYLVNPSNIDRVNKTAGKLELSIKGEIIPVSKKYATHFMA